METSFLVILLFIFLQRFVASSNMFLVSSNVTCIKRERESLLILKQTITGSLNRLSTWTGVECCEWQGVGCDRRNGRVVKLDLKNAVPFIDKTLFYANQLGGELNPSLLNLKHLRYLDLSMNNFSGNIPEFLGSFQNLEYLNLSWSGFGGVIPHHLGNLSRLQYLDLNLHNVIDRYGLHSPFYDDSFMVVDDLQWVSSLSSLYHLDLSGITIGNDNDWFNPVNKLSSLLTLKLASCEITIPTIKFINFTSLNLLDLSYNDIDSTLPLWLSNLTSLMHLHLKDNSFHGPFPNFLGKMTTLVSIGFSENYFNSSIPNLFSNLSSLVYLDLGANNFNGSFPPDMKLCNLGVLDLSWNAFTGDLTDIIGNISDCVLNSLKVLILENNMFKGSVPNKLGHFRKLEHLYLAANALYGPIPPSLGDLSSLRELDFFSNQLNGTIPTSIGRLSNLEILDLSSNKLSGIIPASLGLLSSVQKLDLSVNTLSGNIPTSFGLLSRLEKLNLFRNELSENIPMSLGQLSALKDLDISRNSLVGVISEGHFSKLKNLTFFHMSSNWLSFNVNTQWIPPFQLKQLEASSCNIGPRFPNWLQTQTNLSVLDLSNSSIKDTIPEWFEKFSSNIHTLLLSYNQISGKLPPFHGLTTKRTLMLNSNKLEGSLTSFPSNVQLLDVSDNLLSGHVPHTDGTMNPDLEVINLSKNRFTGSIPVHLCNVLSIQVLDLSQNEFSGRLPGCIENLINLQVIDLSNNTISGVVLSSLGFLTQLKSLHLHNNRFEGNLPLSLQNLTGLITIDIGYNLLIGRIPFWNGETLLNLRILNLQSNKLTGKIPSQLCKLNALRQLNLAHNNINGMIPHCFGNLSGMMMTSDEFDYGYNIEYYEENILASTKGIQLLYTRTIQYFASLDLSSNNIIGEIPDVLMNLVRLKNLNLSRNQLKGQIPIKIGNLHQMESLDLSMNMLYGRIPQSLTSLNFLSYLNLSFNNLSGAIPVGNQLQTLEDPSIYKGNNGLCGPPLSRSCKGTDVPYNHVGHDEGQDDNEDLWFYSGVGSGFAVGFMGLVGSLYFIRTWRLSYFKILMNVYDWISVLTVLNLARMWRRFF